MQIKKPLLIAGAIASIGVASTAAGVSAATNSTTNQNSIVDKLAQKFNLNKEDVQKVFDEERTTHEAEHQAKLEERLTQAVKDGKITEEQKTKIIAKIAEMKTKMESNRDALKDKTNDERKAAMEQERTELEAWAKENNIPTEYLKVLHFKGGGPGGPKGSGGEFHMKVKDGSGHPGQQHSTDS